MDIVSGKIIAIVLAALTTTGAAGSCIYIAVEKPHLFRRGGHEYDSSSSRRGGSNFESEKWDRGDEGLLDETERDYVFPFLNKGTNSENTVANRYSDLLPNPNLIGEARWKEFWNIRYRFWYETTTPDIDPFFLGITEAYSDTNPKALNQRCLEAYKLEDPNFVIVKDNANLSPVSRIFKTVKENNLTKNIWKFCSWLFNKPASVLNKPKEKINNNTWEISHPNQFGSILANVAGDSNAEFWDIKQRKFNDFNRNEWLNKEYLEPYLARKNLSLSSNIKQICYESSSFDTKETNIAIELLKLCSFVQYPYEKLLEIKN